MSQVWGLAVVVLTLRAPQRGDGKTRVGVGIVVVPPPWPLALAGS